MLDISLSAHTTDRALFRSQLQLVTGILLTIIRASAGIREYESLTQHVWYTELWLLGLSSGTNLAAEVCGLESHKNDLAGHHDMRFVNIGKETRG